LPPGWFHQTHDLICFGRTYCDIHRAKDAAAQSLPGEQHRQVGHEWYRDFGKSWDHGNRFPVWLMESIRELRNSQGADAAEERMASLAHDNLDRVWNDLPEETRRYEEARFVWLLYHPGILESWAGVDVIRGRIQRTIDGQTLWEDSPETVTEYKCLRREVSRHHKWRLRSVLARFG